MTRKLEKKIHTASKCGIPNLLCKDVIIIACENNAELNVCEA
jgi:hypothetical protein